MAKSEVLAAPVAARRTRATARTSSKRTWIKLGIGMAIILGAIAWLVIEGLQHSLVFYITPSELLAKGNADVGKQLQLGGQVRPGSKHWNKTTHTLTFVLQDPKAHVTVVTKTLPPPMFRAGIGAVVQGTYSGGVFHANSILVKHSETYVAPTPGELPANSGQLRK